MFTLPALIIRAPLAVATVSGVPVGEKRIYKNIECRGGRLATGYRGAVAIFASRNSQADDHTIIEEVHFRNGGKRGAAASAQAYCKDCDRFKYRLVGFVKLFDVISADQADGASAKDYRALHAAAFDYEAEWNVETYLAIEPLHALAAPGPLFTEACAGCLATPPHNPVACHVGWQHVELSDVPGQVAAAIAPWPSTKRRHQRPTEPQTADPR
jgi:hypothetical protein